MTDGISSKIIQFILDNDKYDREMLVVCAGHVKKVIDEMIKETGEKKTGNWCTQEEWDERLAEFNVVSKLMGKLVEHEPI